MNLRVAAPLVQVTEICAADPRLSTISQPPGRAIGGRHALRRRGVLRRHESVPAPEAISRSGARDGDGAPSRGSLRG